MRYETISKMKVFANQFLATIEKGNIDEANGKHWSMSFNYGDYEGVNNMYFTTSMSLYEEESGDYSWMTYIIVRENNKYSYLVGGTFKDEVIYSDEAEFEDIPKIINECGDHLYEKICEYLHRYTMEHIYKGEKVDAEEAPVYPKSYSPWKIASFMDRFDISPYVSIDVEMVNKRGLTLKHMDIRNLYFNDESNELIIEVNE